MIISMGNVGHHINANHDWNAAYRNEIINRRRGNRSRDSESEVVVGSLNDGGE